MSFPFRRKEEAEPDSVSGLVLEGLEEIPWKDKEHAYGSAKDVPELLLELASRDKTRGEKAIYTFYGNIWHQGTVYEATSFAVPFLQRILADEQNPLRAETLILLSSLAYGHSYHAVHQDLFLYENERDTPEFQATVREELSWVERAHRVVGEGVPLYLSLLKDSSREVRANSAYLASLFARSDASVSPSLKASLIEEREPLVRASLWLALGLDPRNGPMDELDSSYPQADSELERWAIVATMLRLRREDAPPTAIEAMLGVLDSPSEELEQTYGEVPFYNEGLTADSMRLLLHMGKGARRFRVPFCEALSRTSNMFRAMALLETILPLFFGAFSREVPVEWDKLDEDGRGVLRALLSSDAIWSDGKTVFANLSQLVQYYGLPYNREEVRALLPTSS